MSMSIKYNYNYNIIEKEAKAYKYKYPTYENYILKKKYYDRQAYKKSLKYIIKLGKEHCYLTTDKDGLYVPCFN